MSQMMARVTRVTVPSLERAPEKAAVCQKATVRRSFMTTTVREKRPTSRVPPVGFEQTTNGVQFYAIANLDKTSR